MLKVTRTVTLFGAMLPGAGCTDNTCSRWLLVDLQVVLDGSQVHPSVAVIKHEA
jgi:hypothetical protein